MRKTKEDWFLEALNVLIETGADGLTIDTLTARLGVTKGSFYHHFGSYEGFRAQLLAYFETRGTLDIAAQVDNQAERPAERLKLLLEITTQHPAAIDVAIRTWAQRDSAVRAYQERVDARRIAYVAALWEAILGDPAEALKRSRLLYTILVGSEHITPPIEGYARRQLYAEYIRLYQEELG